MIFEEDDEKRDLGIEVKVRKKRKRRERRKVRGKRMEICVVGISFCPIVSEWGLVC